MKTAAILLCLALAWGPSLSAQSSQSLGALPGSLLEVATPSTEQWLGFLKAYRQLRQSWETLARSSKIRADLLQELRQSESDLRSSNETMARQLETARQQLTSSSESLRSLEQSLEGRWILSPWAVVAGGVGALGLGVLLGLIIN